jgi:ferredoxin
MGTSVREGAGSNADYNGRCGAEGDVGMTQDAGGEVTIILFRNETTVTRLPGETLLNCARRAGLSPPYSCEEGDCGTCMAKLVEGSATMQVNEALMDDEVAEGYVLTCQAIPDVGVVKVSYDE